MMEIKETDRIVIAKPVATRPGFSSNYRSFSEVFSGALNPSRPAVKVVRPRTLRFRPTGIANLVRPIATHVPKNTISPLENMLKMATAPTATARKVENPRIPTALNLTPLSTKDASSTEPTPVQPGGNAESNDTLPLAKTRNAYEDGLVSDTQKKVKRAERFGMPMHLTEKEKRNSRAERFGTGSTVSGLDLLKQFEELKKKARAERFGALQSTASDEDAKKKARLARFGSFPTDSAEEDKKKARALRFSQPDCSSKKKAIAGKAGGGT